MVETIVNREMLVIPNANKKDVIKGEGQLGKNDVTKGAANNAGVPADQKVNKVEQLTYLSINIDWLKLTFFHQIWPQREPLSPNQNNLFLNFIQKQN